MRCYIAALVQCLKGVRQTWGLCTVPAALVTCSTTGVESTRKRPSAIFSKVWYVFFFINRKCCIHTYICFFGRTMFDHGPCFPKYLLLSELILSIHFIVFAFIGFIKLAVQNCIQGYSKWTNCTLLCCRRMKVELLRAQGLRHMVRFNSSFPVINRCSQKSHKVTQCFKCVFFCFRWP
jgi:hypothetical protein